jgi:hypothetical protein
LGKWTSAYNWQNKKRQEKKDFAEEAERNYATFWACIECGKLYKESPPIVASTFGQDGHRSVKRSAVAVEYLADLNRVTNAITTDIEYRVWLGLVKHGEVRIDSDNVEGMPLNDIRELTMHQMRLIQKLGKAYRTHGLHPKKYFKRTQKISDCYTLAVG